MSPELASALHPDLRRAMRLEEEGWKRGSGAVLVHTQSGGVYLLEPDGAVSGGTKRIAGAELVGAVYRRGGPIRMGRAAVGLSMEIAIAGGVVVTSPVTSIVEVLG